MEPATTFLLFSAALGLVIGSFLNVLIYRLPRDESIVRPASHCTACGHGLSVWENIPVFSYVWLRGRCRACKTRISLRYPLVEMVTAALFVAVALKLGMGLKAGVFMAFVAALLAAAFIDFEHHIIPNEISLGGLAAGLVAVPLLGWWEGNLLATCLYSASGAFLGGGVVWCAGFVHARLTALRGRRFAHWPEEGADFPKPNSADYWLWFPGMGLGDVKLLAMIGVFLGPIGALGTISFSSLFGAVLGLFWVVRKRRWDLPFGFGPALVAGALLELFFPLQELIF